MPDIIIDPICIGSGDIPLIVLVDDRRSFLGFAIKSHSHGNYSHIMELYEYGYYATQNFTGYRKVDVAKYMKSHLHLKFWKVKNITKEQKEEWHRVIQRDLNQVWWKKRYDFLGILGQALHIKWLNSPLSKYCSERVAEHIKEVFKFYMPEHPTPSDLNALFNKNPDKFEKFGYWFSD